MTTEQNLEMRLGETWVIEFDASGVSAGAAMTFDLALGDQLLLQLDDTAFVMPAAAAAAADAPASSPRPSWRRRRAAARAASLASVTVSPDQQAGFAPETYLYEINATTGTDPDQIVACVQIGRIMAGESLSRLPQPQQEGA
jgi:hypothetical protein